MCRGLKVGNFQPGPSVGTATGAGSPTENEVYQSNGVADIGRIVAVHISRGNCDWMGTSTENECNDEDSIRDIRGPARPISITAGLIAGRKFRRYNRTITGVKSRKKRTVRGDLGNCVVGEIAGYHRTVADSHDRSDTEISVDRIGRPMEKSE